MGREAMRGLDEDTLDPTSRLRADAEPDKHALTYGEALEHARTHGFANPGLYAYLVTKPDGYTEPDANYITYAQPEPLADTGSHRSAGWWREFWMRVRLWG